jgi:hypothetical protein
MDMLRTTDLEFADAIIRDLDAHPQGDRQAIIASWLRKARAEWSARRVLEHELPPLRARG